jgi:hypothetical protein
MATYLQTYQTLKNYALLSAGNGTSVAATTIKNGVYGFAGTPDPTYFLPPEAKDNVNIAAAQTDLSNLVAAINSLPNTTPSPDITLTTITFCPGKYVYTFINPNDQNIVFDAKGNSDAQFFIISNTPITFTNIQTIELKGRAKNCNIFWMTAYNGVFNTISLNATPNIPGVFICSDITFFSNLNPPNINVKGHIYASGNIAFNSAPNIVDGQCFIACYAENTLILTEKGYVPIQNIKTGDKIISKGKIYKNMFIETDSIKLDDIIWISKFKINNLNSTSRPICIEKNALGVNSPFEDLYVSPNHRILINGKMELAKSIVNGKTIYQDNKCEEVIYYHLECKEHVAIVANGVLAETFLDCNNNKYVFENNTKLINDNTLLVK